MRHPIHILNLVGSIFLMAACGLTKSSGTANACSAGGTCKVYVSSGIHSGNLGGVSGADAICRTDINKPADGSIYKAFISDGTSRVACTTPNCKGGFREHKNWIIYPNTRYTRPDGAWIVTSNAAGIWMGGEISDYVNDDFSKSKNSALLTGMSFDFTSTGNNCSAWRSTAGSADVAASSDLQLPRGGDSRPCSQISNSLLCVQQ